MNEVGSIALHLFLLAGGEKANKCNYYLVLSGGGDDIFGVSVNNEQLSQWSKLGDTGKHVCSLLSVHRNDQPMAYRSYCFDSETLSRIVQEVEARYGLCIPA